jgi:uncharacterized integral membrane protein
MRRLRSLIIDVPAVILFIVLALFLVENIRAERYNFLGYAISGNLWWVVMGAALLGFLLAALLFVPGRVSTGWRSGRLTRQADRREQDLTTVRAQDAQHQAELRQVTAERDQQHSQMTTAAAAHSTAPQGGTPVSARSKARDDVMRPPARHGTLRIRLSDIAYGVHEPHTAESSLPDQTLPRQEPVSPRP